MVFVNLYLEFCALRWLPQLPKDTWTEWVSLLSGYDVGTRLLFRICSWWKVLLLFMGNLIGPCSLEISTNSYDIRHQHVFWPCLWAPGYLKLQPKVRGSLGTTASLRLELGPCRDLRKRGKGHILHSAIQDARNSIVISHFKKIKIQMDDRLLWKLSQ